MKRKDIFITIIAEVTGKSKEEVERSMPPVLLTPKMDEEISSDEAEKLLIDLRKERSGILNWAMKGLKRGIANSN